MANMKPASSRSRMDEDDTFGWQLFHDRQRNLVYYLHSYTGEVRWPRPETVGFIMHGLKPLPVHAGVDTRTDARVENPDIWSPYYPHVVMLPSGLVQVHPGPGSEARGATEMWCGYNRFPLTNFGANAGNGVRIGQYRASDHENSAFTLPGPRVLPPTWEEPRSCSPFLPPYPVTILEHGDEEKCQAPRLPHQRLDEHFHTPEISSPPRYKPLQRGELGRVQGSLDWSMVTTSKPPPLPSVPAPDHSQPAAVSPKTFPPSTEKKEHNRKGYLLRQARKMMKDGVSSSAAIASAAPKQPSAKINLSSRELENKQENFPTYGDCESTPLQC